MVSKLEWAYVCVLATPIITASVVIGIFGTPAAIPAAVLSGIGGVICLIVNKRNASDQMNQIHDGINQLRENNQQLREDNQRLMENDQRLRNEINEN